MNPKCGDIHYTREGNQWAYMEAGWSLIRESNIRDGSEITKIEIGPQPTPFKHEWEYTEDKTELEILRDKVENFVLNYTGV